MVETTASEVCRRMNEVRSDLGNEVSELVGSARTLSDWKYYLRAHPWLSLGGATAVGFLLVPKRVEVVTPDVDTLEALARKNRLVVNSNQKSRAQRGTAATALNLLTNAAIRGAIRYVGRNAGKWLEATSVPSGGEHEKPNR